MKLAILNLLLLTAFVFAEQKNSYASDTLHVVSHNRETVVTDPAKGIKHFPRWANFPLKPEEVRKIMLKVTFASPDSMRCADWDYSDRISIRRKGGKKGKDLNYELARMLTPYGGAFTKDWKFQWEVDVTDFAVLLRDSVEIEYTHSGYEPNKDRGWAVTLDFEIIKGKPSRIPLSISKIYDGSYAYGDAKNPIEKSLVGIPFTVVKGASTAHLRIVQTGHGMDEPGNCGEFCNKFREIVYDNKVVDKRFLWKECADNALYPQAGTWLIDRANWCPGYLVQPDLFDFAVKAGSKHSLQFRMQNYEAMKPSAAEVISAYVIQYAPASHKHDLCIDDIIAPSTKFIHSRINTELLQPRVAISNKGKEALKNIELFYTFGTISGSFKSNIVLAPEARDTIDLPVSIPADARTFKVWAKNAGGFTDGFMDDNQFSTHFAAMPVNNKNLRLVLATNKEPEQTSYTLCDERGNVVYERKAGSLAAEKVYREEFKLKKGTYRLLLEDTEHDGLEFWFNAKGGAGYAQLEDEDGKLIKVFQSDFGKSISYIFHVDEQKHTPDASLATYRLSPTRTNDSTHFHFQTNKVGDIKVELVSDPGDKVIESYVYPKTAKGSISYDLSKYPKGRFYFKVYLDGNLEFKKRIRLKE